MRPPYQITTRIIELIASLSEKIGEVNSAHLHKPPSELRRRNRIKTIQASLEIEGNSLSLEQVTAVLDNKRVIAPHKEIIEVQNAIRVYDSLDSFKPTSLTSFCKAHKILMNGLVATPGKLRTGSVGIIQGSDVTHIAPSATMVKSLMNNLFEYLRHDKDLPLIKSCVFHYETEFIHPFPDGNGRMGRLWQTVILRKYSPLFEFLPVESLIKEKQHEYYRVLGEADNQGNSTGFIEFMLQIVDESLEALLTRQNVNLTGNDRLETFREKTGGESFARKDYLRYFKEISSATASRDLREGADRGILKKKGARRTTQYRFNL